jgi:hypothetical protein
MGNLVFGLTPLSGAIMRQSNNLVDSLANAPRYVQNPSFEPGSMDFYPVPFKCQGAAIDLSLFETDHDYTLDFNGTPKTSFKQAVAFRGAYAGEGTNTGWQLQADVKAPRPPVPTTTPTLVWISPAGGRKGTRVSVTLTGADFMPGATVTVSGSGVTAGTVTVDSSTRITTTLTIAANAETGDRSVTISSGSVSNGVRFHIDKRLGH